MAVRKPKLVYTEETPPPSLTRGTVTTEGKAPTPKIQRIDLTQDAGFQDYAIKSNNQANKIKISDYQRDNKGNITGVKLPNGKTYVGDYAAISPFVEQWRKDNPQVMKDTSAADINAELDREDLKNQISNERNNAAVQDLTSQIGQLTPEQQTYANQNAELSGRPKAGEVLKSAGEAAAIAGAGGAVTGAIGGSVIPGLGTVAGAGIVGVGAGLVGGVRAIFIEYKKTDKANFDKAAYNYDSARTNMEDAISLANSGGGFKSQQLAVKNYNQAIAQIDLSERQLKELSSDPTKFVDDIQSKLTEINDYRQNDRTRMDLELQKALQRPTAKFVNQDGVSNG